MISSESCFLKENVAITAFVSRLVVIFLQVVFNLLPDHDAEAFKADLGNPLNLFDAFLRASFDGFMKWDSKYMLHIAEQGYTTKPTFAFFPLFPMTIRGFAIALITLCPVISFGTACILSAVIVNCLSFIGATVSLFELTLNTFGCKKFAYLSCWLFCFNPASIFFSSCYTESIFSFFVFRALSLIADKSMEESWKQQLHVSFCFLLASSTRSNGVINCGFIAYFFLKLIAQKYVSKTQFRPTLIFSHLLRCVALCIPVILPIVLFNLYGYYRFCTCWKRPMEFDDVSCPKRPIWCQSLLPSIYNFIQKDNWGLGLFSYYQWKKLPNFALASPVLILSLYSTYLYFTLRKNEIFSLGLLEVKTVKYKFLFSSKNLFPFYAHLIFLFVFGLLYMHVEVITRMLFSSSPLLYWTVASFLHYDSKMADLKTFSMDSWFILNNVSKLCVFYFASYFVIGTLLHCNFLPWT